MPAKPIVACRLPRPTLRRLRLVAKLYGAESPSAFLRDMLTAILSEEPSGSSAFLSRLGMALGQQRQLDLFAEAQKQAEAARSPRKRVRSRGAV